MQPTRRDFIRALTASAVAAASGQESASFASSFEVDERVTDQLKGPLGAYALSPQVMRFRARQPRRGRSEGAGR